MSEARRQRAFDARICCVEINWDESSGYSFAVEGTSGLVYKICIPNNLNDITLNTSIDELTCTCPDFQKRNRPCKHIYFILNVINISVYSQEITTRGLLEFHKRQSKKTIIDLTDNQVEQRPFHGENCSVCCDIMDKNGSEQFEWCSKGCGGTLHQTCFKRWKKHRLNVGLISTCPLCRANM